MMKTKILFLFALLFSIITFAQTVYVPFKKGNKFGISDEKGKLIMQPEYDDIDVIDAGKFLAFKKIGNSFKKTYISKNKVVLKDTDYDYFQENFDFILAEKNTSKAIYGERDKTTDVYAINGKKIFDKEFNYVVLIEDDKKPALKNEILMLTKDLMGYYSLFLINKKTSKVAKTYFENAILADTFYDQFPNQFIIKYVLARESTYRNLTLNFKNGEIIEEKNEMINSSIDKYQREGDYYGSSYSEVAKIPYSEEPPKLLPNTTLVMKEARVNKTYWTPNSEGKIVFTDKKLSPEYAVLKQQKEKWGYFGVRSNDWIIEPKYDEIFYEDSKCVLCESFVVRSNNKFQFLEKNGNNKTFLSPTFEMYPHLYRKDFGKIGFYLFKLYNADGNFVCYGDGTGKLYYSKN